MSRSKFQSPQSLIAQMMAEDYDFTSASSDASIDQGLSPVDEVDVRFDSCDDNDSYEDDEEEFSTQDLKLGKRFIELVGGVEVAQAILDRVSECSDCIDLLDDDSDGDDDDDIMISKIAEIMPADLDNMTQPIAASSLSSLYNPNSKR